MVKKQKGEKRRKGRSCKDCAFAEYSGDYTVWYCNRYSVYPEDFDYAADVCEGFCPSQTKMRGIDEEV